MSTTPSLPFRYRHNTQLPRSLVRGLGIIVTVVHCLILGWVAQSAMQTVAIDQGGGGGGGGSAGNGVIQVSVLQVPQGEDIRVEISEPKTEQAITTDFDDADNSFTTTRKETKIPVRQSQPVPTTLQAPVMEKTASEGSGTGSGGGVGTGQGTGIGSGTGSGSGSGIGDGIGSGVGSGVGSGSGNGTGVLRVSLSALRYRNAVKPYYPEDSIERRETGQVNIRVVVGTDGAVKHAGVEKSSGYRRLDNAALTAAKRTTFYPYMNNGIAVAVMASIPYRFNLAR